jgi:type IV pilus assembly protein PilB
MLNDVAELKIKTSLDKLASDDEEREAEYLAQQSGLPYVDLRIKSPELDALAKIPVAESEKYDLVPFRLVGRQMHVAIKDPTRDDVVQYLASVSTRDEKPIIYVASKTSIKRVQQRYKDLDSETTTERGLVDLNESHLKELLQDITTLPEFRTRLEKVVMNENRERVSKIIEMTLVGAIHFGVSDIHIEPEDDAVKVRYRIDGMLQDVFFTDIKTFNLVNSRLKLLSGLKLSTQKVAQDGRFEIEFEGAKIEVRVSLVPGNYGENYVMRILDPKAANVSFDSLGMNAKVFSLLERSLKKPYGMILNTGPTGSGKSTTLYACLKKTYTPEKKIITIEDPIEYHMNGITQTQVDTKKDYTFLLGLRAALRQDPDIIMVGEIRDEDTAKVAASAALTGHIVLSTLHTNSAAGAIPRMIDLGVDAKTLGSSIGLVMAQRLCRKLCPHCKVDRETTTEESKLITDILGNMVADGKEVSVQPQKIYKVGAANPDGCEACHNGYKGRIGIFEAIQMTREIEEAAVAGKGERELREVAIPQLIPTMREDGIIKMLEGVTSLEELETVVDIYEK